MRIACVADVHIGNHRKHGGPLVAGVNTRGAQTIEAFRAAVRRAREKEADTFVVAGDLFDYSRPEAPLIAAVQDVLEEAREPANGHRGMEVVLLVGNHDQDSAEPGNHALSPLREWARVVEKPSVVNLSRGSLLALPYDPRPAGEWFDATVDELMAKAGAPCALVVHLGIADSTTAPWLVNARDAIAADKVLAAMQRHDLNWGLAGNWHNHAAWPPDAPRLIQCGALVPTGWDNEGLDGYGGVVLIDDSEGTVSAEVVPGPRFVKVRNAGALKKAERRAKLEGLSLYVNFVASADVLSDARSLLDEARERGTVVGGEANPDAGEAEAAARSAAYGARKAETLDEALHAFVGQMALDEDLDRKDVESRARGYLGGGR